MVFDPKDGRGEIFAAVFAGVECGDGDRHCSKRKTQCAKVFGGDGNSVGGDFDRYRGAANLLNRAMVKKAMLVG